MRNRKAYILILTVLLSALFIYSCREIELVVPTEYEIIYNDYPAPDSKIRGMYVVNEGNMGSNKCTLDYLDFMSSLYARNFYAERNPNVVMELGDVGNDIQIYGNKLYVVVNCSHKVEVLNAHTGKRIGQVDIPNCRYIRFYKGKAYVSSYVGPVLIDPDAPRGAVYKVDTTSLKVLDKVTVGYQPEEMEIVDDYMYVANSGGYRAPNYDNTVSVIQMEDFKQVEKIPVGINLHRVKLDSYKRLWVSSRGDYKSIHSNLYILDLEAASGSDTYPDNLFLVFQAFVQMLSLLLHIPSPSSMPWNSGRILLLESPTHESLFQALLLYHRKMLYQNTYILLQSQFL